MPPPKPTIIFVPGGWHGSEAFSTVRTSLESHGYRTMGISLPSVGAEPPLKTWDPDVEAIRSAIRKVVDEEGGDVVLAMHSYGALPSSEAAKGYGKTEREKEGRKGGVVRLLYICAALIDVGNSLGDPSTVEDADERWKMDVCFLSPGPVLSRCLPLLRLRPSIQLAFSINVVTLFPPLASCKTLPAPSPFLYTYTPSRRATTSPPSTPPTTSTTTSPPRPPSTGPAS